MDAVEPFPLDDMLGRLESAGEAFVRGDASEYIALASETADFTIFGPFGGAATIGGRAFREVSPKVAAQFADGKTGVELVSHHVSGDLAVIVSIERQRCRIGGGPEQDWSLRVTQALRREGGEWKVVHRHADPLTERRSLAEAQALSDSGAQRSA